MSIAFGFWHEFYFVIKNRGETMSDATMNGAASHTDPDCIFCKIIAGEIPSTRVYEDDSVVAFKDINPQAKVHVLIVPRNHYKNVAELASKAPETLAHIAGVAQNIANNAFNGDYRLVFNTGLAAGQTVFHVHAHVLTGEKLVEGSL